MAEREMLADPPNSLLPLATQPRETSTSPPSLRRVTVGQIDKVQTTFHQWEHVASSAGDWIHLTKELVAACETVQWESQAARETQELVAACETHTNNMQHRWNLQCTVAEMEETEEPKEKEENGEKK